jgi:hypothetical protein
MEIKDSEIHIINMKNALIELSKLEEKSYEYKKIYDSIKLYLKNNCIHSIIKDYIDVDYGENAVEICYCEKCYLDESDIFTFSK